MLKRQIDTSNRITAIDKQIADYTNVLNTLNSASSTDEIEQTVKDMIDSIEKEYGDLYSLFQELIKSYNNQYIMKDSVIKSKSFYSKSSLFSSAFIARTIKNAAPIMLMVLFGISVFYLVLAMRKKSA